MEWVDLGKNVQSSDCSMHTHHVMETILNTLHKDLAIVNLNLEFIFNGVMNHNARFDTSLIVLVIPMRFESDWNAFPSIWINVPKSISANLNDSFGKHVWFLSQMMVMLIGVVEASHSGCRELVHLDLSLHCLETR